MGCQSLEYSNGQERFKRVAFGTKLTLSELVVETGTNGAKKIVLKGYRNDTVEAMGLIAEKAAEGAARGLK